MTVKITQHIEQTGNAEYTVTMNIDGEVTTEVYPRTNKVFPAFRSIIDAISGIEDTTVEVVTNFESIAEEYNSAPNHNRSHLQHLRDVAARNGLELTIKHAN